VIGGDPVAPETVPWFAEVGACGGTLVAPNRVVTAAHCVAHRSLGANELAFVVVAGEAHHTARFAMHPGWRHANGDNYLDDVAIVELVEPVTTVAPATLGDTTAAQAVILAVGGRPFRDRAPASRRRPAARCAARRCARSPTTLARPSSASTGATAGSASTPLGCCARPTSTAARP
jgi:Trypsin